MEPQSQHFQRAIDYKKNIAGRFVLLEGSDIKQRLGGNEFQVTRKIDGQMQLAFFIDGETFLINSGGKHRYQDLKCINIFNESLKKAGIGNAVIAAELYMPSENGRPRHEDVSRVLTNNEKKDDLRLAPFDIVEIDGKPWKAENYNETHARLAQIFKTPEVQPVEVRHASNADEVKEIYDEWVVGEGSEGLVVHNESPVVYKIKPRHTIDAVVVGYTTSERGIRSLMFAMRRPDGLFQMFTTGSTGMSEEQRKELAERLSRSHVESQYVLSDSRGVAYQMVKPEIVYEISVLELVASGNDNKVRMNPLLKFDDEKGWIYEGTTPGVSALGITLERERDDKQPSETDIRLSQLTDITPFEEVESMALDLEDSTLLARRVFKKTTGVKIMIHKFLLWKTNKEASGRYPAYIIYHTDFSNGRKEMIKRDMIYTNSEEQAWRCFDSEIAENIKKGWEEVK